MTKRMLLSAMSVFAFAMSSGCSSLTAVEKAQGLAVATGKVVTAYCKLPVDGRELVRDLTNSHSNGNQVKVQCRGDSP